ncbi:hypothetical protein QR680_003852 [Steinernema hermaphroditum]|uniref:Phenylalanine--tRNA ligase, mitochondrial n=1 Tax=Steinernema hermaphroditum TaxID=289476 RepID=A0AA39LSS7_9BILA|nr:hypothetical protein QR680_003852 [Steinernema hermaphroditum]
MLAQRLLRQVLLSRGTAVRLGSSLAASGDAAAVEQPAKSSPSRTRPKSWKVDGLVVKPDERWNLTPSVMALLERHLHAKPGNPLNLIKQRIVNHFHKTYRKAGNRSPLFTVCDREPRVVSLFDNFDSLLTPEDHVSRRPSDTYYVNADTCLRAHTSAHQHKLMRQGFDNFLVVGDVYRRDEIDRTHYPCFHQMEGVRLYSADELFGKASGEQFGLFASDDEKRTPQKQSELSEDASKVLEIKLKQTLEELCLALFGKGAQIRFVDAYFPFTHPSFEVEVFYEGKWLEVLGCGVMEQKILTSAGVTDKVGWAFGLGLERLAMVLYSIPDIRLFWSEDSGFLSQFADKQPEDNYKYVPISVHPQVYFDLSFWLPDRPSHEMSADVFDLIRSIGGNLVEQVSLVDEFTHKKTGRTSHCYRIVYRSVDRALTKEEVNVIHKQIEKTLVEQYDVQIR